MSDKAVELRISGLRCDAAGCGYLDPSVTMDQYEKWLNAPCPKCGASLLTEQDLAAVRFMVSAVDWANVITGPVSEDVERAIIPIAMNGTGFIDFQDFPARAKVVPNA